MDQNKGAGPLKRICGKIGSRVEFTYSHYSVQGKVRGVLLDRVAERSLGIRRPERFFNVIDLIKFDVNGKETRVIRFGYYAHRNGRLTWANRPLTDPIAELQKLFKSAYNHCGPDGTFWFKEFIEGCRGN